ncbi:MAG: acyl-CoA thioester hydrolase/BAAT C-terminal domain-containing protein [Reichenbachiella sp.]|uniref:acyl-CoA thioester hydrolase/BAAT C-terminal domain-containing protein n=1 Tax=Reichenbachiella sp. TaxID=2184521 RepID=UPI003299FF87
MKKTACLIICSFIIGMIILFSYTPPLSINHGKLDLKLYLPEGKPQAMIVGFGGAEGGSPWTSDHWSTTRQRFLNEGFAFLSIGYFGSKTTPDELDRISLNAIYDSIQSIVSKNNLTSNKIALIGGSKGGELILNLASQYSVFSCVIALVPSHVSFPAHTPWMNTSSWTLNEEELTYVPASFAALSPLLSGQLGEAFEVMLKDKKATKAALIPVERIQGSILLLSAENDEQWPSSYMCDQIIKRLEDQSFPYPHKHIKVPGGHGAPLKEFDEIFQFLDENFKPEIIHTSTSSLD